MSVTRPIRAAWRLDDAGAWQPVLSPTDEVARSAEAICEMIASVLSEEVGAGAELSYELDGIGIEARHDDHGVLVAIRNERANPLVVRSALRRLETGSTLSQAVRSSRVSEFVRQHTNPGFGAGPRTTSSVRSIRPFDGDDRYDPSAANDELEFEVEFDVDSANADGAAAPTTGLIEFDTSVELAPQEQVRWSLVVEYIERSMIWSAARVGRTVAANYWRESIAPFSVLERRVEVSIRGRVSAADPDRDLTRDEKGAIERAFEIWRARCIRVIPSFDVSIRNELGAPPWGATERESA